MPAAGRGCRRPGRRSSSRSGSCRDRPRRPAARRKRPRRSRRAAARNRESSRRRRCANWRRVRPDRRSIARLSCVSSWREHCARALQILGRVDAERRRVDERDVDAHARLQRAQLLEPLAPFQRRRRQGDETRQRIAAIGVEPDMVQQRALAPWRAGAGEIERAQPARGDLGPDRLDDLGSSSSPRARSASRASRYRRAVVERPEAGSHGRGSMVGRSPWTLTTTS